WGALLSLMHAAAEQGREPFLEAVRVQERLFTTKPIFLGVEKSLKHPITPCGLKTDAERARHVRKRVREMMNSRGESELMLHPTEKALRDILIMEPPLQIEPQEAAKTEDGQPGPAPAGSVPIEKIPEPLHPSPAQPVRFRPALSEPDALEKVGVGILAAVGEENGCPVYGRAVTVAELLNGDRVLLVKWIRRLTRWNGRQAPLSLWNEFIVKLVEQKLAQQRTPVVRFETKGHKIVAYVSLADLVMRVPVDSYGVAIWRPPQREVFPLDCARCEL